MFSVQSTNNSEEVDCKPFGNNICFTNEDCCTNYCYVKPGFRYGECRFEDDYYKEHVSKESIENQLSKNSPKQKNENIKKYYKKKAGKRDLYIDFQFKYVIHE